MKRVTKLLAFSVCAVLLLSAAALGTIAYLMDSDRAVNVFTVGAVGLRLDEADVKQDGTYERDITMRVQENTYHLLPGHTYIKDPTVTVEKGSEKAYIRMLVTVRNIDRLKMALPEGFSLERLLDGSGNMDVWQLAAYTASEDGKNGTYEFRYHTVVDASQAAEDVKLEPLFERIRVPDELDGANLALLDAVQVSIYAHAMQAAGFENDAEGAWAAFGAQNP